jgi:hypothetical protein
MTYQLREAVSYGAAIASQIKVAAEGFVPEQS